MSHLANDLMEYLQSWNGEDWTRGTFLEQELKIKCRFLGEILIFGGIFGEISAFWAKIGQKWFKF